MTNTNSAPQINPGDISHWPMLKLAYRTDPECIAALLPPDIIPGEEPIVRMTVYNFPVGAQPEYGILSTVDAVHDGVAGHYAIGYGIDQESAIFISRDMNGQPKYPCDVTYWRDGGRVYARCVHQGYTFMEYSGSVAETLPNPDTFDEYEWWIKVSRAVGMGGPASSYDFPPHVVRVRSRYDTAGNGRLEGNLRLFDSPWDPFQEQLPMRALVDQRLWTPVFLDREISLGGPLDPNAFLPFVDTISGSRWLGQDGGPRQAS